MSDDALADLVEAFGHVSDAELRSFLDATTALTPPSPEPAEAGLAAIVLAHAPEHPEPARAA